MREDASKPSPLPRYASGNPSKFDMKAEIIELKESVPPTGSSPASSGDTAPRKHYLSNADDVV
jgi:hypothetical protein